MTKAHNKFAKNLTKIKIETENGDKQKMQKREKKNKCVY